MNYGFVPSKLDGTESKFIEVKGMDLPESYSYREYLPDVINQGSRPICVPCSISAHLNWNKNVDTDGNNRRDNHVNLNEIYNARSTGGDNGMTFKDALRYLNHFGVNSDYGNMKIEKYSMVAGITPIKQALMLNGPLVCAVMVYNDSNDFWNQNSGDRMLGGHALSIVGYDKKGLIIRNSWGSSWGDKGYTHMNWEDINKILECWTIVD